MKTLFSSKKFCCHILVFTVLLMMMIISCMIPPEGMQKANAEVWDGMSGTTVDEFAAFSGGNGTADNPYRISSPADLAQLASNVNAGLTAFQTAHYRLTADINLNDEIFIFDSDSGLVIMTDGTNTAYLGTGIKGDSSSSNTTFDSTASTEGVVYSDMAGNLGSYAGEVNQWTAIGTSSNRFRGYFDGANHEVIGLYINTISDYQGLFGSTNAAGIANTNILNGYVHGSQYIGSFAGCLENGTSINKCSTYAVVVGAGSCIGGFAGESNTGTIANSFCNGIVMGRGSYVGGIVGLNSNGAITNSYSSARVGGYSVCVGGIAGWQNGAISNCYNSGIVSGDANRVGGIAGWNTDTAEYCYYRTGCATDGSDFLQNGFGTTDQGYALADTGTITAFAPDGEQELEVAVTIGSTAYTELLEALNAWAEEASGSYCLWIQDVYPVLYFPAEVILTIYYDGTNLLNEEEVMLHSAAKDIPLEGNGIYTLIADNANYSLYVKEMDTGIDVTLSESESEITVCLYTVSYNANGASGTPPAAYYFAEGTIVNVAGNTDLVKTGYSFEGFGIAPDSTQEVTTVTVGTEAVILYAIWSLLEPEVTLKDNGVPYIYGEVLDVGFEHPLKTEPGATITYKWEVDGLTVGTAATYMPEARPSAYDISCTVTFEYNGEIRSSTETLAYTINKADYDMSGVTFESASRIYNGSAQSLSVEGTLPTGLDGIQVTVSCSGSATDVSEGAVEVAATFATASSNYNVPAARIAYITILPKQLTVTGTVVADKAFDDTVLAVAVSNGILNGVIGTDEVLFDVASANFIDKHAGNNKPVIVEYSLYGSDSGNYSVADSIVYADIYYSLEETEDHSATIRVLSDLYGEGADPEAYTVATGALMKGSGTLSVNGQKDIIFAPTADWNGEAEFNYTITDEFSGVVNGTVRILIRAENDTPVAIPDAASVAEGNNTGVVIHVLANDYDLDQRVDLNKEPGYDFAAQTYSIKPGSISGVASGSVVIEGNAVRYTPGESNHYNGSFAFQYIVIDNAGAESTGTVYITVIPVNDAPVAVAYEETINEDSFIAFAYTAYFKVLDIDTDASLNHPVTEALTVTVDNLSPAGCGMLSVSDGSVIFTPAANWNGTAAFSYTVRDGEGAQSSSSITVHVAPVNDAPVAKNFLNVATSEDSAAIVAVLADSTAIDIDTDAAVNLAYTETLIVTVSAAVAGGTTEVAANEIVFTPTPDWNGDAEFTYTITDALGAQSTGNIRIRVNPVNDAPVAGNFAEETNEDTVRTIDVLSDPTSIDIDTDRTLNNINPNEILTVTIAAQPAHGTAAVVNNKVVYSPFANWNGGDSLTYRVTDRAGLYSIGTVDITVNAVNDAPAATAQSFFGEEGTNVVIDFGTYLNVLDADTDPALNNPVTDVLTISVSGLTPGSGTLTVEADGSIAFAPAVDWNGTAVFTYTVTDGDGEASSNIITLSIAQVNDAPEAIDYDEETDEDTAIIFDYAFYFHNLDIDTDAALNHPMNEELTVSVSNLAPAGCGTLSIYHNSITFTPASDWNGAVVFDYVITDKNGLFSNAVITIHVHAVNDAPVAVNDGRILMEDSGTVINVLANDYDVDSNPLLNVDPDYDCTSENITIVEGSIAGLVGGTAEIINGNTAIRYIPNENWNGIEVFAYTIIDSNGLTSTATASVTVSVIPVNDAPVAKDYTDGEALETDEDTEITIDVLADAFDADSDGNINTYPGYGDSLTLLSVTQPLAGGTVSIVGQQVRFVPAANWNGVATFTYTISDASGARATGTVVVAVNGVNDSPMAEDFSAGTDEDATVYLDVLAHVSDIDTDEGLNLLYDEELTVSGVTQPVSGGTASIDAVNNRIVFVPAPDWNGTCVFTFTVSDKEGVQTTAAITLAIHAVNDNPEAVDDSYIFDEDTATEFHVMDNDYDVDQYASLNNAAGYPMGAQNFAITSFEASEVEAGTVTIENGGAYLRYVPQADWNGSFTFHYTITDNAGTTSTAAVTLTIHAVNDDPCAVAYPDEQTDEDNAITFLYNTYFIMLDIDTDAALNHPVTDTLIVTADGLLPVGCGTLSVDAGRNVTFAPAPNWNGIVTFTYTVEDAEGRTSSALIMLKVNAVNDEPVAAAYINEETQEDASIVFGYETYFRILDIDTDAALNHPLTDSLRVTVDIPGPAGCGDLSVDGSGNVTFMPAADWNGEASFDYTVEDTFGRTSSSVITLRVNPVNDAPVAVAYPEEETDEDTAVTFFYSIYFAPSDIDTYSGLNHPVAEVLTVTADNLSDAASGTLSVDGSGNVIFIPSPDWNGTITFTYTLDDGEAPASTGTITLNIRPINDAPEARDYLAQSVDEDEQLEIDVLAEAAEVDIDTDADLNHPMSEELIVAVPDPVAGGIVHIDDNRIVFVPLADWNGEVEFEYTVTDKAGAFSVKIIHISVIPVNDAPQTVTDAAILNEDGTIILDVLANDTDVDRSLILNNAPGYDFGAQTLAIKLGSIAGATGGTMEIVGNKLVYTPVANWNGSFTVHYTVMDPFGGETPAQADFTVVAVNDAPAAREYSDEEMEEDGILVLSVLDNRTSIDIDTSTALNHPMNELLTVTIATQPVFGGNAYVDGQNRVVFVPAANFNGTVSFTYIVTDRAGESSSATIFVTVNPANDAPSAQNYNDEHGTEDTVFELNVLENIFAVDVDTFPTLNHPVADSLAVAIASQPLAGGTASVEDNRVLFAPAEDWNGTVVFTYTVTDSFGAFSTGTITLHIDAVNDLPAAVNLHETTEEDHSVILYPLADSASIDIDAETSLNHPVTEALVISIVTEPGYGTAEIAGQNIRYIPPADFNGVVTFTYRVTDAGGAYSEAVAEITVTASGDNPVAEDFVVAIDEDTHGIVDVLDHVSDVDKNLLLNQDPMYDPLTETLTLVRVSSPFHGTVTTNAEQIAYIPDPNWNGAEILVFVVRDTLGNTCEGRVTFTVTPVNDSPVPQDQTCHMAEDSEWTLYPLSSPQTVDPDMDSQLNAVITDSLILEITAQPVHGTLVYDSASGALVYRPEADYNGADSYRYIVTDSEGSAAETVVTLYVDASNDVPQTEVDTFACEENETVSGNVLHNDSDIDADFTLNLDPSSDPSEEEMRVTGFEYPHDTGTLTMEEDGTFLFVPAQDYNGQVMISYSVIDSHGAEAQGTLILFVHAQNSMPAAQDDSVVTNEDTEINIAVTDNDYDADFVAALNNDPSFRPSSQTLAIELDSVRLPQHGTATVCGNIIRYLPAANWNGIDTFYYRLVDQDGAASEYSLVTVTVIAVNDKPVISATAVTVNEDGTILIDVLANASDVDSEPLLNTYSDYDYHTEVLTVVADSISGCTHGTAAVVNGKIVYTPTKDWSGVETFSCRVRDTSGAAVTATVRVTVIPADDAPTAPAILTPVTGSQYKGGQTVEVAWTESVDSDGDTLSYQLYFFDGDVWTLIAENLMAASYAHVLPETGINTVNAMYRVEVYDGHSTVSSDNSGSFKIDSAIPSDVTFSIIENGILAGIQTSDMNNSVFTFLEGGIDFSISNGSDMSGFRYYYQIANVYGPFVKYHRWNELSAGETISLSWPGKYIINYTAADELGNEYQGSVTIIIQSSQRTILIGAGAAAGVLLIVSGVLLFFFRPKRVVYLGVAPDKKPLKKTKIYFTWFVAKYKDFVLDYEFPKGRVIDAEVHISAKFAEAMKARGNRIIFKGRDLI
jgi:hypothetical protein